MKKICEICESEFETVKGGSSRIYCYECSLPVEKGNKESQVANKIHLRRAMKKRLVEINGGKCSNCGYDKCLDALTFHHINPEEKDFGLASNGNSHSWKEYLKEAEKCVLVCANCHAEVHSQK